jgi:hypothetical protein
MDQRRGQCSVFDAEKRCEEDRSAASTRQVTAVTERHILSAAQMQVFWVARHLGLPTRTTVTDVEAAAMVHTRL